MSAYQKRKGCALICLYVGLFNLIVMVPVNMFIVIPGPFYRGYSTRSVLASEATFNTTIGAKPSGDLIIDQCYFNLTNGNALLTVTPTPKPAFEEVCVKLSIKSQAFDFELNDDLSEATYKTWTVLDLANVYDYDIELVTINPNLIALIGLFGSETVLAAVQSALYGALQFDTMGLKPDGTGALNDGLFVRHTLREMMKGYTVPTTGQPDVNSAVTNVYLGYETLADMQAAIAAFGLYGSPTDGRHFTKTVKTGLGKPADLGRLAALKGHRNFSTVPASDGLWLFSEPGWDAAGNMSPGHATLDLDGQRMMGDQAPLPLGEYPWLTVAGIKPIGQLPSFGTSVTMLDEQMLRTFTYECANDCAGERIHNAVAVQKYTLSDATYKLTSGGVVDTTGACVATATCDYGMSEDGGFVAAGQLHTLPYLGTMPYRNLVSITPYGGGNELVYDRRRWARARTSCLSLLPASSWRASQTSSKTGWSKRRCLTARSLATSSA